MICLTATHNHRIWDEGWGVLWAWGSQVLGFFSWPTVCRDWHHEIFQEELTVLGIHFVEKGMRSILLKTQSSECPLQCCYCSVEAKKEKCLFGIHWVSSWPLSMEQTEWEASLSVCFKLYSGIMLGFSLTFRWPLTLTDSAQSIK